MRNLFVASDHAGLNLKWALTAAVDGTRFSVEDLGPHEKRSVDYPDFAQAVAQRVAQAPGSLGLLVCGTGIGMSIAANKVAGARAALCRSEFEARMARQHNDANILCLGERVTGQGLAEVILSTFLTTEAEGGRHAARVDKIRKLERLP